MEGGRETYIIEVTPEVFIAEGIISKHGKQFSRSSFIWPRSRGFGFPFCLVTALPFLLCTASKDRDGAPLLLIRLALDMWLSIRH